MSLVQRPQGTGLIQADFFLNSGGLNITDSPFMVQTGQAIAGYNYEYLATGGITKRNGNTPLNASADAQLRSLGYFMYNNPANNKTMLRAAGIKLQTFVPTTGVTTNVTDDTVTAGSTPFEVNTTQPVVFSQFNTAAESIAWFAGGGQGNGIINGYVGPHYTVNGVNMPTGVITATTSDAPFLTTTGNIVSGSNIITGLASTTNLFLGALVVGTGIPTGAVVVDLSGSTATLNFNATATATAVALAFSGALPDATQFWYAVSFVKNSTTAEGNASLDLSVVTGASGLGTAGGNTVTLDLSGITNVDTTLYSSINIYRASVSGVSGFTIGDLAGTVPIGTTTFTDYGAIFGTALPVPRNGNQILDNSQLPTTSQINVITKWKNRLVLAEGSTVYLSDINKSESWPSLNFINVPSGGPITALGIISYITPVTASPDEVLVIFKERELWILVGTDLTNWSLQLVDYVGCVTQPLLVFANGFLFWLDYRGFYCWDGSGKPIYISRLIEYDFGPNGDLTQTSFELGCGAFFRKQNEIIWYLTSNTLGEQKLALKLDLRLSLPIIQQNFQGRMSEAVFIKDSISQPIYACHSALPSFSGTFLNEVFFGGDESGFIYSLLQNGSGDGTDAIPFTFRTKIEDFQLIGTAKRYHKVIVWCRQSTTANLTLKYWVNYKTDDQHASQQIQQVGTQVTVPIWDVATWDGPYFDTNTFTYAPLTFNLGNPTIGIEGDALTLEFQQEDFGAPMIIAGYSVIYSIAGLRK